jgi:nucleoside-diphosphate-sugar epimerase
MSAGAHGTVGITGANGYVGSIISRQLRTAGWNTVDLVRSPPAEEGREWRRYALDEPVEPGLVDGLTALVHCAYDLKKIRWADIHRVNVLGTRRLLAATRGRVGRVVVISSMSAYAGTRQLYGSAKLLIERDALAAGAVVVRPGLVYGAEPGGMVGTLTGLARLPFVPVPARRSHQFTIHEDDLAAGVAAIIAADESVAGQVFGLAHPASIRFEDIILELARRAGRSTRVVPIPWRVLYLLLRTAEVLPVRLPVRADSLLGLARPAPSVPNVGELEKIGVQIRPLLTDGAR